MNEKKSFIVFNDYKETLFKRLSDEQIGRIIRACIDYNESWFDEARDIKDDGFFNNDTGALIAFDRIRGDIDIYNAKWEKRRDANRINGLKGGRPKVNDNEKANDNANANANVSVNVSGIPTKPIGLLGGKNTNRKNGFNNFEQRDNDLDSETMNIFEQLMLEDK